MSEMIENAMVTDWWWNEIEYGVSNAARMKRERQAYDEAEREGFNYGKFTSEN